MNGGYFAQVEVRRYGFIMPGIRWSSLELVSGWREGVALGGPSFTLPFVNYLPFASFEPRSSAATVEMHLADNGAQLVDRAYLLDGTVAELKQGPFRLDVRKMGARMSSSEQVLDFEVVRSGVIGDQVVIAAEADPCCLSVEVTPAVVDPATDSAFRVDVNRLPNQSLPRSLGANALVLQLKSSGELRAQVVVPLRWEPAGGRGWMARWAVLGLIALCVVVVSSIACLKRPLSIRWS